jgi:hypothetical protein
MNSLILIITLATLPFVLVVLSYAAGGWRSRT